MVFQDGVKAQFSRLFKSSRADGFRGNGPLPAAEAAPASSGVLMPAGRAGKRPPANVAAASAAQDKRRNDLEAENMAQGWIRALRRGDYAYRVLKDQFDRDSEEVGLNPVSDHRFARWLAAAGGERYRCHTEKTVMYKMPRRRVAASSGERARANC